MSRWFAYRWWLRGNTKVRQDTETNYVHKWLREMERKSKSKVKKEELANARFVGWNGLNLKYICVFKYIFSSPYTETK